jgi:alpha-galactosidase
MHAYATLQQGELVIGNNLIERRWRIHAAQLFSTSLLHKATGRQWALGEAPAPSLNAPAAVGEPHLRVQRLRTAVSAKFLRAELTGGPVTRRFDVFDDLAAITVQLVTSTSGHGAAPAPAAAPSGIEQDRPSPWTIDPADLIDCVRLDGLHCDLVAVEMAEQTDMRDNLVFQRRWKLSPPERHARGQGNVFFVEHRPSGEGFILLKHAPAPYARPHPADYDVRVFNSTLEVRGNGWGAEGGEGYPHSILCYSGGKTGRTAILQRLQMHLRLPRPGRDGLLLSNTWGNRSRDAAISESFLLEEVKAGAQLGVEVMQVDDGWQKGRSANSVEKGGVWSGFWASDEAFWSPNPARLPQGLQPVVAALAAHGMSLGLWFAPDSADDCANWKRDAEQVLSLWRRQGVRHVKIDAVEMRSKAGEANVRRFYEYVLSESGGEICFDPDVTAGVRPGYWGLMDVGPIFVENRYTDWHNYWPHHTLRNLWQLAHYIPPSRLRMEFLDASRNGDKYPDDPLAPGQYAPDTLFATVMFSSPLAWCEVSRLPPAYVERIAPLVAVWKRLREALLAAPVIPIGEEPDGYAWTGFQTLSDTQRDYALVFNELSPAGEYELPDLGRPIRQVRVLHGDASVAGTVVSIRKPLGYALLELLR